MATPESEVIPVKPPRPPNSWILYRAYMMKKLQPEDPRERRISQAEMSAQISRMWKAATDQTRAEYEAMADHIKVEHQKKYPGYKYQPRKKEDKERERDLLKQKRQAQKRGKRSKRGVSDSTPAVPPPAIQPMFNPYFNPHTLNFVNGLSPPLSAMSSPPIVDASTPPQSLMFNLTSTVASTMPTPQAAQLPIAAPTPSHVLGMYLPPQPETPIAAHQEDQTQTVPTEAVPQNLDLNSAWNSSIPQDEAVASSDVLSFDIGNNWADLLSPEMASFMSSSAPGLFQVQGFDPLDLNSGMGNELELSIPDVHVQQDVATYLSAAGMNKDASAGFSMGGSEFNSNDQFDLSFLLNPYPQDSSDVALSNMGFFDPTFTMNGTSSSSYPIHTSPIESSQSQASTPTPRETSFHVSEPVQSHPYVPPAGAAYSSSRRVGGNWSRPPYISASSQG